MSRIQNKLSDYDRAIRVLDKHDKLKDPYKQKKLLLEYINSSRLPEKRKKLIKKLKYYRNPEHMEDYHSKYYKIQTKEEGIIKFNWKHAQRVLWYKHIYPKLMNNEPVRIYLLKARQIGFSTQIEGIGSALSTLFSDRRGTVVAHDQKSSGNIFRMCKLYYKSLPDNFRPARKLSNRHELEFANPQEAGELGLESIFTVNTAQNQHLGASYTLNFIHLSEFARYEEVNTNIEDALVALFQTIPEKPRTFIFIETTAYGEGLGKRYWDNTKNGFDKIFISWVADIDYTSEQPLDIGLIGTADRDEYGNEFKVREQIIEELKVWYTIESEDEEWLKWESLKRLTWRREYIDKKTSGKIELFQQEYPLTPEEAFRITGRSVFDSYKLIEAKKRADNIIPGRYSYNHIDNKLGDFVKDPTGLLKVFYPPVPNKIYFIGADIGAGHKDSDYSVLQLFDNNYNQIAVYKDTIEPDMLAYPLVKLAKIYNNARIVPEANTMGISTISRMIKDIHYNNIYIRKKFNTTDKTITNEWGFYTSMKTRPILINTLRQLISSNTLQLNDPETIIEFLNFVFVLKNGKLRMEGSAGMHDDMVLATGLAIIDIPTYIQTIEENRQIPYDSIEWHAQRMDKGSYDLSTSFGSVTGL